MTAFFFISAIVVIVVASELFTNAVEWAGFRMKLSGGATGSLLAAIGTALPEATVPVVALLSGAPSAVKVATGAVLGAPFLLLTLGVCVTGIAVAVRGGMGVISLSPGQTRRDLGTFVIAFTIVIASTALPRPLHYVSGVLLLAIYGLYVRATLRGGSPAEAFPEPLHLMRRREEPWTALIVVQLLIAVGGLILGSKLFVTGLDQMAASLRIDALILALVLVPFATELPETLNSVLWIRSNDDGLAFGNVAGSATFQACILGFIGLTFTPWQPGLGGVLSAGITLVVGGVLFYVLRNGHARGTTLALAGIPWVAYVVAAVVSGGQLAPPEV